MKSEPIELVTKYRDGKEVKEHSVQIFARPYSATRTEFYAAYGVGLAPKYVFNIWEEEYKLGDVAVEDVVHHATHIRMKNELYEIVRTYSKNRQMSLTVK